MSDIEDRLAAARQEMLDVFIAGGPPMVMSGKALAIIDGLRLSLKGDGLDRGVTIGKTRWVPSPKGAGLDEDDTYRKGWDAGYEQGDKDAREFAALLASPKGDGPPYASESGHRLEPRCSALMPTDTRCDCGYDAWRGIRPKDRRLRLALDAVADFRSATRAQDTDAMLHFAGMMRSAIESLASSSGDGPVYGENK